jgi:hypothetical protein
VDASVVPSQSVTPLSDIDAPMLVQKAEFVNSLRDPLKRLADPNEVLIKEFGI